MAVNWPGLLAWSTQHHDGTAPSRFRPLSDEDRQFLERAMEEAFGHIEDPNQVMLEAINQIKAEDRTDASIITSLEVLDRCCDDVDCARNVEKLDGIQPLLDLVTVKEGQIRVRALEILALLFSNNLNIQEAGMRRCALAVLLRLVRAAPAGSEDRSKAFRALVALVRPVQAYEETFLRQEDGVTVIQTCLGLEEDPRTREKALSFVRSLIPEGRLQAEEAGRVVASVAPLFGDLSEATIQYREILAATAMSLARAFPEQCRTSLEVVVEGRIAQLGDSADPESSELGNLKECLDLLRAAKSS